MQISTMSTVIENNSAADTDKEVSVTGNPKTEARLMAVQALYQYLLTKEGQEDILRQFVSRHIPARKGDSKLFEILFKNSISEQERYIELLQANMAENWRWDRLGYVEQALLLAATSELDVRQDTPLKVVLNEFITIAHSYFEQPEVAFINGVLDKAAKALRA